MSELASAAPRPPVMVTFVGVGVGVGGFWGDFGEGRSFWVRVFWVVVVGGVSWLVGWPSAAPRPPVIFVCVCVLLDFGATTGNSRQEARGGGEETDGYGPSYPRHAAPPRRSSRPARPGRGAPAGGGWAPVIGWGGVWCGIWVWCAASWLGELSSDYDNDDDHNNNIKNKQITNNHPPPCLIITCVARWRGASLLGSSRRRSKSRSDSWAVAIIFPSRPRERSMPQHVCRRRYSCLGFGWGV